jgi:hypothetical protein
MSIDWFSPNGLVRRLCIGPGNNADVCQRHMNVLLEWASTSQLVASARPSSHLRPVLKQAVQQWLPCAPVEAALTRYLSSDSSSSLPPPPELLALLRFDESRQRVAHSLIANLCRLVPMCGSVLMSVMSELFPYHQRSLIQQYTFFRNALIALTNYMDPLTRTSTLELLVDKILKIDVYLLISIL